MSCVAKADEADMCKFVAGLVVPMPTLAAEPSKKAKVLPFPSAILKSLNWEVPLS